MLRSATDVLSIACIIRNVFLYTTWICRIFTQNLDCGIFYFLSICLLFLLVLQDVTALILMLLVAVKTFLFFLFFSWVYVDKCMNLFSSIDRVATDLENLEKSGNLKETFESQGICQKSQGIYDRIPKVREKSVNFVV